MTNLEDNIKEAKKNFGDAITINIDDNSGEIKFKDTSIFKIEGKDSKLVASSVISGLNVGFMIGFELGKEVGMDAMMSAVKKRIGSDRLSDSDVTKDTIDS